MKNMSFGKMLGLFGGFLLLMIVCAFVFIKLSASSSAPQVTTKRYNRPEQAATPPRAAEPFAAASTVPAVAPAAVTPVAGDALLVPAQVTPGAVVPGQVAVAANAQRVVIPATPGAINDVNQNQNIANVSAAVINLDARVAMLENERTRVAAAAPRPTPVRRVRKAAKPAVKVVVVREATPLTAMHGYKAMAVVGGRAWVSAPDGSEDSVVVGEPVPRARVRSMSKESGLVITTNDQRIDPVR